MTNTTNPQEHVQSVTLRSGKELKVHPKKVEQHVSSDSNIQIEKGKEGVNGVIALGTVKGLDPTNLKPISPFPQRLTHTKQKMPNQEILEVFKEVKINLPLLNAIKQVPTYAKFLKDLCTAKCRVNVPKKVFLTKPISMLLNQTMPTKYKDPGLPIVSYTIRNTRIGQALLDLGVSDPDPGLVLLITILTVISL